MWKKYKFELNFKRCGCRGYPANRWKIINLSGILRGARTTPAGKRERKKSREEENNYPPPNTRRIFCEYFGGPARTQATERILGKGGSPRYPRLRGQRRKAKDDAKKAETGNRTPDLPLTKRLLYQLSYLGINNGKLIRYRYFTKNKELLHVYFFTARVGADKTLIFSLSPAF